MRELFQAQLARRCRERRLQLGWTNKKLAEYCGVDPNTIVNIETQGRLRGSTIDVIDKVVQGLGGTLLLEFPSEEYGNVES